MWLHITRQKQPLGDPNNFRRIVGRLLYLGFTRPDISHATQQLSQVMQDPQENHLQLAMHVLRYLKGTINYGLFYPAKSDLCLKAFCDSDWATCKETRKSITGYCITFGPCLISWKTKKQNTVSKSTAEAEYQSMCTTACEIRWISYLLTDFEMPPPTPIKMFCDNEATIAIARKYQRNSSWLIYSLKHCHHLKCYLH